MNKKALLNTLIEELQKTLDVLVASALDAKESATNEESKAENKYDTRGLEASYLAGAQSKRAEELQDHIERLKKLEPRDYSEDDPVHMMAVVAVLIDEEKERRFFILPYEGGHKLHAEGMEVLTITPETPVGKQIMGKHVGDSFEITLKSKVSSYEIIDIC